MNAKNRTGVYRRDYHRPNRKENKSMFRRSFGRGIGVNTDVEIQFQIPRWSRAFLIQRALKDWNDHHNAEFRFAKRKTSVERKCFEFLRHRQTNLDAYLARVYGASYLLMIRKFCDAVTEQYDWLRDECERHYKEKASQKKYQTFKVLKRSLTSLQVEDFNATQEVKPDEPLTEEEEVPLFFKQLSSLDQERFLYLPPFLKPHQVRERRFGEDANDRWWEWEEQLGLTATEGRPNPLNANWELTKEVA